MVFNESYLDKKILITSLDSPFLDNQYVFPYLGITYLAAVAQKLGLYPAYLNYQDYPLAETKFQESNFLYSDEFWLHKAEMYQPFDLLGISCFTPQAPQAYAILRKMKEIKPWMPIIIGGPHATHYTQECINAGFDAVCMGDGERIFEAILTGDQELLRKLRHPFSTERTLVLADSLSEQEMDSYPVPVRQERYIGRYKYALRDRFATTLVNSRDCPMRCAFCEHGLSKRGRWHSVEHFQAEIESILHLEIRGLMIFDDLFALSLKRARPYLDVLKKYHDICGLIFRCFGHAGVVAKEPEILEALAESGCVEMGFGAESASQEILDNIEKHTKVADLHNFVEKAIDAGISVKAFFMMGLPGESLNDFIETQNFIKLYRQKCPSQFDFDLAVFFPYKGSKIGKIIRLGEGETLRLHNVAYRRQDVALRIRPGMTWAQIDGSGAGAYKQKGGGSDVVTEPYDWDMQAVLLPAEEIEQLKEETMALSGRYTNGEGHRIQAPLIEGSIGSVDPVDISLLPSRELTHSQIAEFLKDVDGWLTTREGQLLYKLASECSGEGVIVEIGSWKGKSTIWLAHGTKVGKNIKIYAIDPHTGSTQTKEVVGEQWTYPEFINNLKRAGVKDAIEPMVMTSEEAAKDFDKPVELIFIDGDHAYEMVKLDFDLWFPKLVIGGHILFHDSNKAWPGPERVVQERLYNSPHFSEVGTVGSITYAKKVAD